MKRTILLCAFVTIAMVAAAQDVTLANLLNKPELTQANIFVSSFEEITKEWDIKQEDIIKEGSIEKSIADNYTYANCPFSSISFEENGDIRKITYYFLFDEDSSVPQKDVLNQLTNDLQQLGFGKIKLKNGLYRQKEKLPAPYTSIMIGDTEGMLFLSLVFKKGQLPNF